MSNADNDGEGTKLANTHVPDKVYAYSLQVRHALYELLNCSNNQIVSIEVLDDVAIENHDGAVIAVQLKSVLSNKNPITDRAVDLWKTFYNWLLAVKDNELNPDNTTFHLFVAASRQGGEIVSSFNAADTFEDAVKVWRQTKLEFYDQEGNEKNWD